MNYFVKNKKDEGNKLDDAISGPSKSSQKTKTKELLWDLNDSESSYSSLNLNYKLITRRNKEHNTEKNQNETSEETTSEKTRIKQLLLDRLKMYISAEENARKSGELRKFRHLNGKIQILKALVIHHDSGNIIDLDNIPPEIKNSQLGVTFKEYPEITVIPSLEDLDSVTISDSDSEANLEKILCKLRFRRDQYKISVAQYKTSGNVIRALEHLNIIKMFDTAIKHLEMGENVDINDLPAPPEGPICHLIPDASNQRLAEQRDKTKNHTETSNKEPIISHNTVLNALQDRLRAYEISRIRAKKESTGLVLDNK